MIEIIRSLNETTTSNGAIASYDADHVGAAYADLTRHIQGCMKATDNKIRELLAGFQDLKWSEQARPCLTVLDGMPTAIWGDKAKFDTILIKILNHAISLPEEEAVSYMRFALLEAVEPSIKTVSRDKINKPNDYDLIKQTIAECKNEDNVNKDFVESANERISGFILEAFDFLDVSFRLLCETHLDATPETYSSKIPIFAGVLRFVNFCIDIYANSYMRFYMAYNKPATSEVQTKAVDAENNLNKIEGDIEKIQNLQDRYTAIHNQPNMELDRKLKTLTERQAAAKAEYATCHEAATKETEENLAHYKKALNDVIDEIREFYETFNRKEFLEPREKHIDKMEEYLEGALDRKFPLRIPLYKVDNASKEVKDVVRNDFIPAISAIVDKYKEFIILAPKFDDESDDMFIYLTLREPHGEADDKVERQDDTDEKANASKIEETKTQNESWTKSDYSWEKDGRFYKVYSPDGRFLGNCDSLDDVSDTIREDIAEQEQKSQNEATLSTEERNNLKPSDFGVPEIKGYPLTDEEHIRKAIQFFQYCKPQYKETLAKNIAKKIIEKKLVGKICVAENNPGKKYFPKWMLADAKATMKFDESDNSYEIYVDGKKVAYGTIKEEKESTINESVFIDPNTGHTYL